MVSKGSSHSNTLEFAARAAEVRGRWLEFFLCMSVHYTVTSLYENCFWPNPEVDTVGFLSLVCGSGCILGRHMTHAVPTGFCFSRTENYVRFWFNWPCSLKMTWWKHGPSGGDPLSSEAQRGKESHLQWEATKTDDVAQGGVIRAPGRIPIADLGPYEGHQSSRPSVLWEISPSF